MFTLAMLGLALVDARNCTAGLRYCGPRLLNIGAFVQSV